MAGLIVLLRRGVVGVSVAVSGWFNRSFATAVIDGVKYLRVVGRRAMGLEVTVECVFCVIV